MALKMSQRTIRVLLVLVVALLMLFLLAGCTTLGNAIENMSEKEKQTAMIVAGIVVASLIIADNDGDTIIHRDCHSHGHDDDCDD